MKLTIEEQAIVGGSEGTVRQKAMELLVHYGESVDAERLIDTNNVCGDIRLATVLSMFNLESTELSDFPLVKAYSCQMGTGLDPEQWQLQGVTQEQYEAQVADEAFAASIGVNQLCTCAPYLIGNVPVKGEHCAWQKSSAVVYINSVFGARTNGENNEITIAAMLTGKIPYWGLHLPENRLGTHLINVEWEVKSALDWELLGYYTGHLAKTGKPVFYSIQHAPNLRRLKGLSAALQAASECELFHIPGITAEARNLNEAFGGKHPLDVLRFGKAERMLAFDMLNACAHDSTVDWVILGCPHCSLEELGEICRLLAGQKVHSNVRLWIITPRALQTVADRTGYTRIINKAGGVLMSDACPAEGRVKPQGAKVVATNSAKQAHCLTGIPGMQCWFGSTADCITAAVTGKWQGELK